MQLMSTMVNNQPSFSTTDTRSKISKLAVNFDDFIVALPPEIRELILQKLDIADYHRFSAVCKTFRSISVTAKQNLHFSLQQLPWLMLSSSSFQDNYHGFFSLRHEKIFKLKLPEVHGCRCCGSSWGWLIMANESGDNFLLNPFSRLQIQLPSQTTLAIVPNNLLSRIPEGQEWIKSRSYIRKAMLSTPPTIRCTTSTTCSDNVNSVGGNCIVVAIYACHSLCFCRLGDQAWTDLGNRQLQVSFQDVIFYNGQLYAVTNKHDLVLFELGTHRKSTRMNLSCPEGHDPKKSDGQFIYLVESCGELLMVVRIWYYTSWRRGGDVSSLPPRRTTMFKVFKLDSSGPRWVKVDSLDDQMLFVGTSSGISLSVTHFSGFRGNCIYFTDESFWGMTTIFDGPKGCSDLGIFSLDDGSIIKSFFPTDSHSYLSPPIWYIPSQV